MNIVHVETGADIEEVRVLFQEYAASLGFELSFQNFDQEIRELPGKYAPPKGCLLLARENAEAIGCVALRPLNRETCEMKRLYVRSTHREKSIGRLLAETVITEAIKYGYALMYLDTVPSMQAAKALYLSLGFRQIPPYYDNPIPGTVYLELKLNPSCSTLYKSIYKKD